MPFYSYTCPACQAELTKLQKLGDPAPPCPRKAWHGTMAEQVTAASFQLKVGGFYGTGR